MSQQSKIDTAKANAAAALSNELARIARDDALRNIAPEYGAVSGTGYTSFSNVDVIRYEATTAKDVLHILKSWRDMHGVFMPIRMHKTSCAIVTAFPWGEYVAPDTIKKSEDDAIQVRNHKGRGFSSVEFKFYQHINGRQIEIYIVMAFRTFIQGFEGYINAHYDRNGDVDTVEKRQPAIFKDAAYCVSFGGGGMDSADWYGVFKSETLLNILEGFN